MHNSYSIKIENSLNKSTILPIWVYFYYPHEANFLGSIIT